MVRTAASDKAYWAIVSAVSFYWFISISMVFINKSLLSSPDGKIDAPLFITFFQCFVTVAFLVVAGGRVSNIPPFEVDLRILWQMMPLSFIFTLMIVFNNLCLKYVEVSFYQVARSLTIVFNVIFDFVVLGQSTSLPAIGCCAIVVSGFLIGNNQEIRWSLQGVVFGVMSSFFVAMNSIYVKKMFPLVDNNPWKLTLYNNINASLLFIPLVLLAGEPAVVLTAENARKLVFWLMMTAGGLMGVLISFATAAQIKFTSPLTHNVSATAKAAAQTVLALIWFRNPITILGGASVAVVLAGSLLYTLVRRSEMNRKQKLQAEDVSEREDKAEVPLLQSEKVEVKSSG
jgi:solute carrier family 35 (GDP-fucose transporter), member C1